jgi:hypothetical protein
MRKRLNTIDDNQYEAMDTHKDEVKRVVSGYLETLHGEELLSVQVVGAMPYPMKDDRYVATYNLRLRGRPPITLAKVVVNLASGELEEYDPEFP